MRSADIREVDFLVYALEHYENPQCSSLEEFYEDLDRIKYLKRLFNRPDDDQKNRLILNHLIILVNVFGIVAANEILFFRMEEKYHGKLKTYLQFMKVLSNEVRVVDAEAVGIDETLLKELEKI